MSYFTKQATKFFSQALEVMYTSDILPQVGESQYSTLLSYEKLNTYVIMLDMYS